MDTPTKSERREAKRLNARKHIVTGRSVFLLQELGRKPKKGTKPWATTKTGSTGPKH